MITTGNRIVDNQSPYIEVKNSLVKCQQLQPDVIFLGDQLTSSFNLNKFILSNKRILNCGLVGDTLSSLYARLGRDVIEFKPKKVILNIGINDLLLLEKRNVNIMDEQIIHLFESYKAIVDKIVDNNIPVICTSVIKINELQYDEKNNHFVNYMYLNDKISKFNDLIAGLVNKRNIKFVDYNYLLVNEFEELDGSYTTDGINLNEKAYLEIAYILYNEGEI